MRIVYGECNSQEKVLAMSVTMYSRLWSTYDDRGRKIRLRAYRELQGRVATGSATDVMIDRATNLYASHLPTKRVGILIGLFIPVIMLVGTEIGWWAGLPLIAIPIVVMVIVNGQVLRKIHTEMADVFVGEGVCAGCAYPLGGLRPDESGHVVCPECSASWNESRIVRFAEVSKKPDSLAGQWLRRASGHIGGHGPRSIHDDREVFRTAASMRIIRRAVRDNTDTTCKARLRNAKRCAGRVGRHVRLALASIFVLMIVFHFGVIADVSRLAGGLYGIKLMLFLPLLVMPLMFSLFVIFILRGDMGRKGAKVRDALLTRGLCPSCVADLDGIEPEEDGCTVCAECSSAWKLTRLDTA